MHKVTPFSRQTKYRQYKIILCINFFFFLRLDVKKWVTIKKLKELPLPRFYGFGSTIHNDNKYRFIVIEKFDKDLEAFLQTVSDGLLLGAVINIIRQIVNNT